MNGFQLIEEYANWLKENSFVRSIQGDDVFVVTTPFTDSSNDHLDIYVQKGEAGKMTLSDDGYTLSDLIMNGTDIFSTDRRKQTFQIILNRYGVQYDQFTSDLYVEATASNIAVKKHNLLQAMLAVTDLYVVSKENIYSFFKEDVEAFFREHQIIFTKSIKLTGKTGYDYNIDFIVPEINNHPEKLIQAINVPQRNNITSVIFAYNDIAALREEKNRRIVIYNDEVKSMSADSKRALNEYDISAFPWSEKDQLLGELQPA